MIEHDHELDIAYGFEMMNGGMAALNHALEQFPGKGYFVSDWSSFDKTIPPWLIREAFDILERLIDFTMMQYADGTRIRVDPIKQKRRWKKVIDYFIETPIRTNKGERFLVTGGVPSGSCFTNIIDSIINSLVTRYLCYQTTGRFPYAEISLGHDGVYILEDMARLAKNAFGMELNTSKSYVTTNPRNVHFLGYFNFAGYPFKSLDFLIASFVQPEHKRKTALEAAAAALGQLWTCMDPKRAYDWYRVVRYCCEADNLQIKEVAVCLRNEAFRHKYLQQVGIVVEKITLPAPCDNEILEVMPKFTCKHKLKIRYTLDKVGLLKFCNRHRI